MIINIAMGRAGLSSTTSRWARNDSVSIPLAGVVYANLADDDGIPTGVSLSCSAAFSGAGTGNATSAAGGWPTDVFAKHVFLNANTTRTLTFAGLPANTEITLAIAGHRGSSPTRDLHFTFGGNVGVYDQSGVAAPTAPAIVVGNTDALGNIALVVQTTTINDVAYLSGISLSYAAPPQNSARVSYYLSDSHNTTAIVSLRAIGGGSLQLRYSINPDFSGATTTAAVIADASTDYVVKFNLTGLTPGTTYYYQAVQNGFADLALTAVGAVIPKFKTAKSGQLDFRIALSSCALTGSTSTVFNRIRAKNPEVMIHHGDIHYADIATNDLSLKRAAYLNALSSVTQNNLYRTCPLWYRYDDHDYGINNSAATYVGKVNSAVAVREIFPQVRANPTGTIQYVTTRGRVKVIQLDTRYEKSGATILGAAQLNWFKNLLAATVAEIADGAIGLIIVDVSVPWVATAAGDTWSDATAERTDIANYIWGLGLQNNIVFVAGDMHACAYSDGTNNNYDSLARSGWPVIQSGALDNTGSTKGGPYTFGAFAAAGQYTILDIADVGHEIVGTVKAYNASDAVLYTATFSVPAIVVPVEPENPDAVVKTFFGESISAQTMSFKSM